MLKDKKTKEIQKDLFSPIKIESNPQLEKFETILNIGGIVCPFSAIVGLGIGFYNKKLATDNLRKIVEQLNTMSYVLKISVEKIIENERTLAFNMQKIFNAVVMEKQEEKIIYYRNLILNGFFYNKFFNKEDDSIDIYAEILSQLRTDELKVAEYIYDFFKKQKGKSPRLINLPFLDIKRKFDKYDDYYLNYVLRKLVNMGLIIDNTFALIGYVGQPFNFTPKYTFDFRSYCYENNPIYEDFRKFIIEESFKEN